MKHTLRSVTALVLVTIISACGGGGSASLPRSATASESAVPVAVRIVLDNSVAAAIRRMAAAKRPAYISPSTQGASLNVYTPGNDSGTPIYGTVSALSAGSNVITIYVAPGTYDFVLTLYDEAPVSGAIPSGAHALSKTTIASQTIIANASNNLAFHLQGIVVGAPTFCSNAGGGSVCASYMSLPANGVTQTLAVAVSAYDADGNVITGSNPYYTPLSVSIAESGGSGHSSLVIDGTDVGASGTLESPADSLAIKYDGGGAPGYTTTTTIGSGTLVVSPMYVTPDTTISEGKLVDSHTAAVTEQGASSSIAYSASTSCGSGTTPSNSGSGASATLTVSVNVPGGTNKTCSVTETDILGSAVAVPYDFIVPGPIVPGTPTFPSGGSGLCSSSIAFTGVGQTASVPLADSGYGGSITASSSATSVATVSMSGSGSSETATVTAVAAGTATVTLTDTAGNSSTCSIGVTTTSGSAS